MSTNASASTVPEIRRRRRLAAGRLPAIVPAARARALRATGIRPRKFYATRHTFISASLEAGYNIKRLADYCGTSVEMIERHYAGYLRDETPEEMLRLGGQPSAPSNAPPHTPVAPPPGVKTGTQPGTFRRARPSRRQIAKLIGEMTAEGGRFELREDDKRLEPESCTSPESSERNAAKSGPQQNPETTRKSPT